MSYNDEVEVSAQLIARLEARMLVLGDENQVSGLADCYVPVLNLVRANHRVLLERQEVRQTALAEIV